MVPLADLYDALRPLSVNLGAVDCAALIAGRSQTAIRNPKGRFRLLRIGDALVSRNSHAAVYDGLRYAKDFRDGYRTRISGTVLPIDLRNRIVFGARTVNMAVKGLPAGRCVAYYAERVMGGAAMIVVDEGGM